MAGYKQNNQFNEKDSLQDILIAEKEVVKMYTTAVTEADGNRVFSALKTAWEGAVGDQHGVYELMKKNGYYEPQVADKSIIDREKDTFKKAANGLE